MVPLEMFLRAWTAFFEWAKAYEENLGPEEKEARESHWKRTNEVFQWLHETAIKHVKKD